MKSQLLKGEGLSRGVGYGAIRFVAAHERKITGRPIACSEVDQEITRYRQALLCSQQDIRLLKSHYATSQEVSTILDSHLSMLEDPLMTEQMEEKIRMNLQTSESVFQNMIGDYQKRFSQQTDPFFQERLGDVVDVAQRILHYLCPASAETENSHSSHDILFAVEFTPSQIAALDPCVIKGLVSLKGGPRSHAALIAKAKGIPYVSGIAIDPCKEQGFTYALVDGGNGTVVLNPSREELVASMEQPLTPVVYTLSCRKKGLRFYINAGSAEETAPVKGAAGIGLFRTEYHLLQDPQLLFSEERQYRLYQRLVQNSGHLPVTVRLFDLGGDKIPPGWEGKGLESAFGVRGIRFLLQNEAFLKTQLRALLRLDPDKKIRILLPFISDVEEIRAVKRHLQELGGTSFPLGAMIELPSAALMITEILKEVDFVSIGTNDLSQYTLGVDRLNSFAMNHPLETHPSVIYLIRQVLLAAKRVKKEAVICGDMASNPLMIPRLIALGATAFSCQPEMLSQV